MNELVTLQGGAVLATTPQRHAGPVASYLARLQAATGRRSMASCLDRAARILWPAAVLPSGPLAARVAALEALPWSHLEQTHLTMLQAVLADRHALRTTRVTLAAVRGVLRECWRDSMIDGERLARVLDLARLHGDDPRRGRDVDAGELARLWSVVASDPTPRGARDGALLALIYGGGLRRSEACALEVSDLAPGADSVTVRRGKGRKSRVVHLASGAAAWITAWIDIRGRGPGPVLLAVDKLGRIADHGITGAAVGMILDRLATSAGVAHFAAHDLRRSWVGDLLEAGADLAHVQGLAGHASPTTTALYDRRPDAERARAARLLALPARRTG